MLRIFCEKREKDFNRIFQIQNLVTFQVLFEKNLKRCDKYGRIKRSIYG
jgi:hypothetical protein